ncbi:MAG: L-rhamnose mutarotase [Saprospiraceae bacterium]
MGSNGMQKIAFTMQLKPGYEAEYKKRHDEIWPELSVLLTKAGIRDYSIFLDENSGCLFAVHWLAEPNQLEGLPETTIMKKWWAYMGDIMETNADNSPVVKPLQMVFHMD